MVILDHKAFDRSTCVPYNSLAGSCSAIHLPINSHDVKENLGGFNRSPSWIPTQLGIKEHLVEFFGMTNGKPVGGREGSLSCRTPDRRMASSMTLLFGNRTQVVELLVKCFTAQLCSRDKTHAVGAAPPNLLGSATCPQCVDIPFLASSSVVLSQSGGVL